jgi:septum formation protein
LLRAAGIAFEVHAADVDETPHVGEDPGTYVRRVAEAKARAIAVVRPPRPVLAADTAVVVDGEILGKPRDEADARRMLRRLAGRSHEVLTGVTLMVPAGVNIPVPGGHEGSKDECGTGGRTDTRVARTLVELAPLSDDELSWYVSSGEPVGKAGAYAIQGLASRFVARIEGSYSNVVGLPIALVWTMCKEAGILVS